MEPPSEKVQPRLSAATLSATARANPQLRASTHDRDDYIDVVKQAFADGQLDRLEFDDRITQTLNSKTLSELSNVLDGLNLARLTVGAEVVVPQPEKAVALPKQRVSVPAKVILAIVGAVVALLAGIGIGIGLSATGHDYNGPGSWANQGAGPGGVVALTQDEIPADFDQWFGEANLDYGSTLITHDSEHDITLNVGELTLIIPSDANVVVNYDVGAGEYTGNSAREGVGLTGTDRWTPNPGGPTITFNIKVSAGEVTVRT